MKKNILYAQSGGVTPVINATACGVIETARNHRDQIGKVYAGKDGIIGVLKEELIDTSKERKANISALRHTPGGAFGSCRYKLKSIEESRREYERLIEVCAPITSGIFSTMAAVTPPTRAQGFADRQEDGFPGAMHRRSQDHR